jgi:hypothetical protein
LGRNGKLGFGVGVGGGEILGEGRYGWKLVNWLLVISNGKGYGRVFIIHEEVYQNKGGML